MFRQGPPLGFLGAGSRAWFWDGPRAWDGELAQFIYIYMYIYPSFTFRYLFTYLIFCELLIGLFGFPASIGP